MLDHLRSDGGNSYAHAMGSSIIRLFSGGKRFNLFWDKLEIALHEACVREVERVDRVDGNTLYIALRERFTLYPIELGPLEGIAMKPTMPKAAYEDSPAQPVKAVARVGFLGSPVLLQLQPEADFRFPFNGQHTKRALLLHSFLPDYDARDLMQKVCAELDRIKPLLKAFRPTVAAYDERLRARIEAKIRSF